MQGSALQNASETAREARAIAQALKEAVKKNSSLDKDVEFQRKQLRRLCLKLLLLYPNSKEAKDAEAHIWIQTSYQFISIYKQRIGTLDKKLFSASVDASHNTRSSTRQEHNGGGHVEYRKVLTRFRQFLAEEERFYTQLLVRLRAQFDLTVAQPALAKADILVEDPDEQKPILGRNLFPEQLNVTPTSEDEREARLATFNKFLICLGDIARYREQYNDSGGRPRAGHEEGAPRKSIRGGRRGGHEPLARPRNYARAQTIYEQARLLVPDVGNASHQLAILASYQKDSFASLLHYYRALCVRQPYDTASDNLNTVLKKALEQYRIAKRAKSNEGPQHIPKLRVDRFKGWVVVLHGLWYLDSDATASRASIHANHIISEFDYLIKERILLTETVSDVMVLSLASLWKLRMIRDSHIRADRKIIEPIMSAHVLDLARTLLLVGSIQIAEKPEDVQDKEDLAQMITVPFRRILPAIRIFSKWLRSNLSYVESMSSSAATPPALVDSVKDFWATYAMFFTCLSESFPLDKLPLLSGPLEEDVDMCGFSPIRKSVFKHPAPTETGLALGQDKVHPNEELLMRISDLLEDAGLLVVTEKSPITLRDGKYILTGADDATMGTPTVSYTPDDGLANIMYRHPDPPRTIRESDDDNTTQTSRTDDVIREAFNAALEGPGNEEDDDDDDDEVIWRPPKLSLSPDQKVIQPPQGSPQAFTAVRSTTSVSAVVNPVLPSSTTAQDLLNNVLGFPRINGDNGHSASSSAPQASLLFGSGSPSAPTKSIWTNTEGMFGSATAIKKQVTHHPTFPPAPGHGRPLSSPQPWNSSLSSVHFPQQTLPTQPRAIPFTSDSVIGSSPRQNPLSYDFYQPIEIVYDSQQSQPLEPAVYGQEGRSQEYPVQQSPYGNHRATPSGGQVLYAPSVERTSWNT